MTDCSPMVLKVLGLFGVSADAAANKPGEFIDACRMVEEFARNERRNWIREHVRELGMSTNIDARVIESYVNAGQAFEWATHKACESLVAELLKTGAVKIETTPVDHADRIVIKHTLRIVVGR